LITNQRRSSAALAEHGGERFAAVPSFGRLTD
jgi:hypothetical protein